MWKQCQILYLGDFTQTKFHVYVQLQGLYISISVLLIRRLRSIGSLNSVVCIKITRTQCRVEWPDWITIRHPVFLKYITIHQGQIRAVTETRRAVEIKTTSVFFVAACMSVGIWICLFKKINGIGIRLLLRLSSHICMYACSISEGSFEHQDDYTLLHNSSKGYHKY